MTPTDYKAAVLRVRPGAEEVRWTDYISSIILDDEDYADWQSAWESLPESDKAKSVVLEKHPKAIEKMGGIIDGDTRNLLGYTWEEAHERMKE